MSVNAPIIGWESSYVVAQLDRDGRVVKTLSAHFESLKDAERVYRWKRRRGVALVQILTTARVLSS